MGYPLIMRTRFPFALSGVVILLIAAHILRADLVEMQNGDRYSGKVLSVSADTVVLESEVLGKINVPRNSIASLAFGTNATPPNEPTHSPQVPEPTNLPAAASLPALAGTNADLSAAFRNLGANTNFIRQIREQMLAGNAGAASNYDAMLSGLMSGKLNINDLRREARSSADQLRALKRDLGPEAGDALDSYLEVLDNFLKETAPEPTSAAPAPQAGTPGH